MATSPKKIEAVTKWPVPQTVYDVRSEPENVISVEITKPRRSVRERKQPLVNTRLFLILSKDLYGNPLLYTITCKLTPRFVPVFFNKMSETLESLQTNYLMDSKSDDSS